MTTATTMSVAWRVTHVLWRRRPLHHTTLPLLGHYSSHANPLGLPPRSSDERVKSTSSRKLYFPDPNLTSRLPMKGSPPLMPKRNGGLPMKQRIGYVKKVIVVSSGKGGVGKSTIAVNLALSLSKLNQYSNSSLKTNRVGLLDLDIHGPSLPTLMGLQGIGEPELTSEGALIPLQNYGIKCMSIGFLIESGTDNPVVWRGMMVMKAVQQLLFDVDWRGGDQGSDSENEGLDVLVIDMPPGTGDVALSLGQLVQVDGAVIVSTPQDIALIDVRKGVSMFKKMNIPIAGFILNMAYFKCPHCDSRHYVFGSSEHFHRDARTLGIEVLGELALDKSTSIGGDAGKPITVTCDDDVKGELNDNRAEFRKMATTLWTSVQQSS